MLVLLHAQGPWRWHYLIFNFDSTFSCRDIDIRLIATLRRSRQLNLDTVDTVHTINEKDQDKDEGYLKHFSNCVHDCNVIMLTLIPYCNFATNGLSEMKVKSLRFQVYGKGTMSSMNMLISETSRRNTYNHGVISHCMQGELR